MPANSQSKGGKTKRVLVVTHGGFIGEFQNVVRLFSGRNPVYANNAKNTAMFIIDFARNHKKGLKCKTLMENDNEHTKLEISESLRQKLSKNEVKEGFKQEESKTEQVED